MKPARNLIRDLEARGIELSREGNTGLHVAFDEDKPPTKEMRALLLARKPELMIRLRLRELAEAEGVDAALVDNLPADDIAGFALWADDALRGYVRMLHTAAMRERGQAPKGDTARALCKRCGPVLVSPVIAFMAPMTNGWPTLLGCCWCRTKNRKAINRPEVKCGECQHFARDAVNPGMGAGECRAGEETRKLIYPFTLRECASFQPARQPPRIIHQPETKPCPSRHNHIPPKSPIT
jgi:RNase P subunit RPR2